MGSADPSFWFGSSTSTPARQKNPFFFLLLFALVSFSHEADKKLLKKEIKSRFFLDKLIEFVFFLLLNTDFFTPHMRTKHTPKKLNVHFNNLEKLTKRKHPFCLSLWIYEGKHFVNCEISFI